MPAYCEVALPVPLDRTFTYAVREGEQVMRGARVIAPFRKQKLIGVITASETAAPTDFEAKYFEAVLDDEPLLSEHLLALAEWIAGYYLAPLGEVLRGMLPLMAEVRRVVYYRITDSGRDKLAGSLDGDGELVHPDPRAKNVIRPVRAQTNAAWSAEFSSVWRQANLSKSLRCARPLPPVCRCWPECCARSGSPAKPPPLNAMRAARNALPSSFLIHACRR